MEIFLVSCLLNGTPSFISNYLLKNFVGSMPFDVEWLWDFKKVVIIVILTSIEGVMAISNIPFFKPLHFCHTCHSWRDFSYLEELVELAPSFLGVIS